MRKRYFLVGEFDYDMQNHHSQRLVCFWFYCLLNRYVTLFALYKLMHLLLIPTETGNTHVYQEWSFKPIVCFSMLYFRYYP